MKDVVQYPVIVRVDLLPEDRHRDSGDDNGEKIERPEQASSPDTRVQEESERKCHDHLERDVYGEERQRVQEGAVEEHVADQPVEVLQSDPLHRRHDVPAVEDKYEGEDERIGDERAEKYDIREYEPVCPPVAPARPLQYLVQSGHLFHSTMRFVRPTASRIASEGPTRPYTAHDSYSCAIASNISLRSGASSIPRV